MPYTPGGAALLHARVLRARARPRCATGGVVCQWVPVHAMPRRPLRGAPAHVLRGLPRRLALVLRAVHGAHRPRGDPAPRRRDGCARAPTGSPRSSATRAGAGPRPSRAPSSRRARACARCSTTRTKSSQPALREAPPGALVPAHRDRRRPVPRGVARAPRRRGDHVARRHARLARGPRRPPRRRRGRPRAPASSRASAGLALRDATSLGLVARSTEAVAEFRLAAARGPGGRRDAGGGARGPRTGRGGVPGRLRRVRARGSRPRAAAPPHAPRLARRLRRGPARARRRGPQARSDASEERAALEDAVALARRAAAEEGAAADATRVRGRRAIRAGPRPRRSLRRGRDARRRAAGPAPAGRATSRSPRSPWRPCAPASAFPADATGASWDAWRRIRETALPCAPK